MSALTFQPCFWGPFCRIRGWWEGSQLGEMAASPQSKPWVRTWRSPFPASQLLPAKNNSQGMLDPSQERSARNPGQSLCQEALWPIELSWERGGSKCYWFITKGDSQPSQHPAALSCQVSPLCPSRKTSNNCCLEISSDGWFGLYPNMSCPILRCWGRRHGQVTLPALALYDSAIFNPKDAFSLLKSELITCWLHDLASIQRKEVGNSRYMSHPATRGGGSSSVLIHGKDQFYLKVNVLNPYQAACHF